MLQGSKNFFQAPENDDFELFINNQLADFHANTLLQAPENDVPARIDDLLMDFC